MKKWFFKTKEENSMKNTVGVKKRRIHPIVKRRTLRKGEWNVEVFTNNTVLPCFIGHPTCLDS